MTPIQPPQLIRIYGSPMECLSLGMRTHPSMKSTMHSKYQIIFMGFLPSCSGTKQMNTDNQVDHCPLLTDGKTLSASVLFLAVQDSSVRHRASEFQPGRAHSPTKTRKRRDLHRQVGAALRAGGAVGGSCCAPTQCCYRTEGKTSDIRTYPKPG